MKTDKLIFRKATGEDIPFMSQILVDAAGASGVNIRVNELPAYPDTYQYIDGFPNRQDVGIIAETENRQPVGAAWVRLLPTDAHAVKYPMPELTMGVVTEYRGMGIGGQLMVELYKAASETGLTEISLGVHRDNAPAVGLYRKQNWVEDGFFEEYIMMSRKL